MRLESVLGHKIPYEDILEEARQLELSIVTTDWADPVDYQIIAAFKYGVLAGQKEEKQFQRSLRSV